MFRQSDVKEVIMVIFTAIYTGLVKRNKKMINVSQIMVNLEGNKFNFTEGEVKRVIGKLIEIKYIRYSEIKGVMYYGISQTGEQRYQAYLSANFEEIDNLVITESAATYSNIMIKDKREEVNNT